MNKYLKIFSSGLAISFIGSLPIGTLSASIAYYTMNHFPMKALEFGLGSILVEAFMVRLSIFLLEKVVQLKRLFRIISIILCLLILFLAIKTLVAAYEMHDFNTVLPIIGKNPFLSGILLSLLNPLHLPFWMGWTLVMKNKFNLGNHMLDYTAFILSVCIGTAGAFILYGLAGNILNSLFKEGHNLINWIMGLILLVSGFIIAIKILNSHDSLKSKMNQILNKKLKPDFK